MSTPTSRTRDEDPSSRGHPDVGQGAAPFRGTTDGPGAHWSIPACHQKVVVAEDVVLRHPNSPEPPRSPLIEPSSTTAPPTQPPSGLGLVRRPAWCRWPRNRPPQRRHRHLVGDAVGAPWRLHEAGFQDPLPSWPGLPERSGGRPSAPGAHQRGDDEEDAQGDQGVGGGGAAVSVLGGRMGEPGG